MDLNTAEVTITVSLNEGRRAATYSRTYQAGLGNPLYHWTMISKALGLAEADVRSAIEAVHGKDPTALAKSTRTA
jgi:hypothetical protein